MLDLRVCHTCVCRLPRFSVCRTLSDSVPSVPDSSPSLALNALSSMTPLLFLHIFETTRSGFIAGARRRSFIALGAV